MSASPVCELTPWTDADRALALLARDVRSAPADNQMQTLRKGAIGLRQYIDQGFLNAATVEDKIFTLAEALDLGGEPGSADEVEFYAIARDATMLSAFREDEDPSAAVTGHARAGLTGRRMMPELRLINPVQWRDQPVPEREWIVRDLIPAKTVTLLSGDGAAGKTTLGLQLATARALSRDWIGTVPTPGRTLFLSAEDDADEIHRRLDSIRAFYGSTFTDMADIHIVDLVGENAVLGEISKTGIINATAIFEAVVSTIEKIQVDLVVIDALADAFAGDENNRSQARQFIGLLKRPARQYGCAFLCLAHPSLSGMSSGTGTSGSTGWNNSVRSRLYF